MLTDEEIIKIAADTKTGEPGLHGYILPISFAREIERAVLAKAGQQEPIGKIIKSPECGGIDFYFDKIPDGETMLYAHPLPAQSIPEGWQPIGTAPKTGRKILLSLLNIAGKRRTIVGFWVEKFSVEDNSDDDQGEEKDGTYYWREGWYESMESHDDFSCLYAAQESITNWMPMPDASMLSASPKPE